MDYGIVAAAAGIALVDLVLSGDNALVIGAAAGRLPRAQRFVAIMWGGIGAVVLRLLFAIAATELLQVPYLRFVGGIMLFGISIRLLLPDGAHQRERKAQDRLIPAVITILIADATMSLDNVLAVGALAAGNITLLVMGLLFSMALLFVASSVIARLIDSFSWLIDVAAIVLAWTSASLVLSDPGMSDAFGLPAEQGNALRYGFVALIILIDLILRAVRARRSRSRAHLIPTPAASDLDGESDMHDTRVTGDVSSHQTPAAGEEALPGGHRGE